MVQVLKNIFNFLFLYVILQELQVPFHELLVFRWHIPLFDYSICLIGVPIDFDATTPASQYLLDFLVLKFIIWNHTCVSKILQMRFKILLVFFDWLNFIEETPSRLFCAWTIIIVYNACMKILDIRIRLENTLHYILNLSIVSVVKDFKEGLS